METVILDGLAAGCLTVILCTSEIAEPLRRWIKKPLHCPFCTSFWTSLFFDPTHTVFATMALANVTILLLHWSMTTYGDEYETSIETEIAESDDPTGDGRQE